MSSIRFRVWLMAVALLAAMGAKAADIDLFAGSPGTANPPNVLFVIDTGASFSASNNAFFCNISADGVVTTSSTTADATKLNKTNGGVEQCALYTVLKTLETSTATVNVGVMMFNNKMASYDALADSFNSTDCSSGEGGCLVLPIVPLNTVTGPRIREWIRQWDTSGSGNYYIKAPANRGDGVTMQEAWAYYFGKTGMSGRVYPGITGCASKNIIYLGNNWAQQASPKDPTSPDDASALKALKGLTPTVGKRATPTATVDEYTPVQATLAAAANVCTNYASNTTLDTSEGKGNSALNWALYMKNQGATDVTKGVTTYAVALQNPGCDRNYGVWLPTLADKGGGEFFSVNDYASLVEKLKAVLGNIASVNSVFASVSLPVSVNTQGTYLNDIYVGMFRPAKNFMPRWNGNLKQYKLGLTDGGVLKLQDADGTLAINTQTGFLTECARSYWTPKTVDTYWTNEKSGGCLTVNNSTSSNYPDGNIVEKGAQGYKLRSTSPSARTVKTCSATSCTALTEFSTGNSDVTASLSNDLINWARGTNLDAELSMTTSVMRASAHGDVVHSRPIPVNYGTNDAPSIVVYYGGNDGMFRAVNGNRGDPLNTATGVITSGGTDYTAGSEMWAFVPPEFYGKFQRLRDNTLPIGSHATSANISTQKSYGMDGPTTAYQGPVGGTSKVYIYGTMRRGGRAIYAFDATTPGSPSLLWKKGCDDTGCSTGYSAIGQTWSSLKPIFATGYGSGTAPLMITGGGYDTCEDYDATGANHCPAGTTMGNRVYVIDAVTGAVVKEFGNGVGTNGTIERPVIADSTIVRDGSTGAIKYAYTADMGGNVYRLTFGTDVPSTWTLTKIASLGCASLAASPCAANRKFMFAPTVVTTDQVTFHVMLGSGDREKPVTAYTGSSGVTNYFFSIKDTPGNDASPSGYRDETNCGTGATSMCLASLVAIGSGNPTAGEMSAKPRGWYLALAPTEQVVTAAITVYGVVTFSTHKPAGPPPVNSCIPNLGNTNVYNISYLNAASANGTSSRFEHVAGDGLPPSPVAGQVTLDNGQTVPFCIGCSKDSPLEGSPPRTLSTVAQPTNRLYWYIQK